MHCLLPTLTENGPMSMRTEHEEKQNANILILNSLQLCMKFLREKLTILTCITGVLFFIVLA